MGRGVLRWLSCDSVSDLALAPASSDEITEVQVQPSVAVGAAVSYRVCGVTGPGITEWQLTRGTVSLPDTSGLFNVSVVLCWLHGTFRL